MRRGQALKVTRGASVVAFSIVPRINASGLSTYDRGWPGIRSGVAPVPGSPFFHRSSVCWTGTDPPAIADDIRAVRVIVRLKIAHRGEREAGGGADILLRLAGVKPNSDAMRIISSACLSNRRPERGP